jgi:hypothetical protein
VQLGTNDPQTIPRSEQLALKVASTPIPTNGGAGGVLTFGFKDLQEYSYADVFPEGTVMKLFCRDAAGKLYDFTFYQRGPWKK